MVLALAASASWCGANHDSPSPKSGSKPGGVATPVAAVLPPPNPYEHLRARGKALRVLSAARSQMTVPYIYGAQPRGPQGLRKIGMKARRHGDGFDCSTFVAYAFEAGLHEWISGTIAHTDQIWTQGGRLPLKMTAGRTRQIVRGVGAKPPNGGYRPGDILLLREGAGGYFGHTVLVSEHGLVIQALAPGVQESQPITTYLTKPRELGWVRVKALSQA